MDSVSIVDKGKAIMIDDSDDDDQVIPTNASVEESSAPILGPTNIYIALGASGTNHFKHFLLLLHLSCIQ